MKYAKVFLRIYLSSGFASYNDESVNENVSISFKKRYLAQATFILLFFITFIVFSSFEWKLELTAKVMAALYLLVDLYLLANKTKIQSIIPEQPYYSSYSMRDRVRNSFIGGLNIYIFFMLFMS